MSITRITAALPYGALLAATAWFYVLAGRIDYAARPGQLGPDLWPKAALALMAAVCVFQIVKALAGTAGRDARGIADSLDESDAEPEAPRRPALLGAGIALTIAYGVVVTILGFPLATAGFMVAFMYLGGSRSHVAIWLSSLLGVALISLLLLRVVYVSLPRGVPPLDRITDFFVSAF
jgi:putative tricarboxylic transport membrane protein